MVLGASAACAADPPDKPPPAKNFTGQTPCAVVRITAANVLVVRRDGEELTIRLIGAYVPQSGSAAEDARLFATRLLTGESVYLESDPNWPARDEDGRAWSYVYRAPDGLFVNLELVRQGFARVSAGGAFEHQALFTAYERVARQSQKGLWGLQAANAADARTTQPALVSATQPAAAASADDDTIVYVTEHGKKYHRKDCAYVRNGSSALKLKDARARGCTPCSKCKPPR